MSPRVPHWTLATPAALMYHRPVDGRQTARSVLLSPAKLPGTGTSPRAPYVTELAKVPTCQLPVAGSHVAASVLRSPLKSPAGTGSVPMMLRVALRIVGSFA